MATAHTAAFAQPFALTAGELAELARENYEADLREQAWEAVAEAAAWNKAVQNGDWSLGDWLDYTGRSLDSYIPAVPL